MFFVFYFLFFFPPRRAVNRKGGKSVMYYSPRSGVDGSRMLSCRRSPYHPGTLHPLRCPASAAVHEQRLKRRNKPGYKVSHFAWTLGSRNSVAFRGVNSGSAFHFLTSVLTVLFVSSLWRRVQAANKRAVLECSRGCVGRTSAQERRENEAVTNMLGPFPGSLPRLGVLCGTTGWRFRSRLSIAI